jgi:lysophospholipase L1-like esterase
MAKISSMGRSVFVFALSVCLAINLVAAPIRVACVGDSITYGAAIQDRENNSYPVVLGRLLGDGYNVKNFGVNGATLLKKGDKPYWKESAFAAAQKFQPQLVIIKLGSNDSKPQNWKYKNEFTKDLIDLVRTFDQLRSKPQVWICKPAPVAMDRWGITEVVVKQEVIPAVVAAARRSKGVELIDIYTVLAPHPEMFPDGVHPNAAGAKLMAAEVHSYLK